MEQIKFWFRHNIYCSHPAKHTVDMDETSVGCGYCYNQICAEIWFWKDWTIKLDSFKLSLFPISTKELPF